MSREPEHELNRRTLLKAAGATGAVMAGGGLAAAGPGRKPGPKENEVLVGVSAGASGPAAVVEPHVPDAAAVVHEEETLGFVAVAFPAEAETAQEAFQASITDQPRVKYVEPNTTHRAMFTPNDPQFGSQYVPQQIGADVAWDTTLGDCDCSIAIVDTGVDCSHPDLCYCSDPIGYDFADDDSDPSPDDTSSEYHGTAVAGVAAAKTNNDVGIAGVTDASLVLARALDKNGSGSTSDIAEAIRWAADQGADVINLSLGGGGYTDTMKNAVSYAYDQGSLLVGSAGGSASADVAYPAAYEEVIAASALDSNETLASFSSYGPEIELAAPGVDVLTTTTDARGSYEKFSGTSFAAAVVSGAAGLVCAQWGLSNSEARRHLKATATDVGLTADEQGCGKVNANAAVNTDPANSGSCDGTSTCGDRSTTGGVSDSLTNSSDYDCWSWNWEYSDPCEVVVELDGPTDADFDLYVSEGTTSCPSLWSYDYASTTTSSQEQVVISNPDTSTDLQIDVESYSGSGSYDLTITEKSI